MPFGVGADLGFVAVAVVIAAAVWFETRRRWRMAVASREEVRRLAWFAAEEAARAEAASLAYVAPPLPSSLLEDDGGGNGGGEVEVGDWVMPPPLEQPQCAVCYRHTTTRCSRCKAVRYCSGKCQIIHWRQGHKDECRPSRKDDHNNGGASISSSKGLQTNQSDMPENSVEIETKAQPKPLETSSAIVFNEDHIDVKPFVDVPGIESTDSSSLFSLSSSSVSASSRSTVDGPLETSDDASANDDLRSSHYEKIEKAPCHDISANDLTAVHTMKANSKKDPLADVGSSVINLSSTSDIEQKVHNSKVDDSEFCSGGRFGSSSIGSDTRTNARPLKDFGESEGDHVNVVAGSSCGVSSNLLPSKTRTAKGDSFDGIPSSEGTTRSNRQSTASTMESSSSVTGERSTNMSSLKVKSVRPVSSFSSVDCGSAEHRKHSVSLDRSAKNGIGPGLLTKSVEATGALPNGTSDLKTSVKRVVQQSNGGTHSVSHDTSMKYDSTPVLSTKPVETTGAVPNRVSDSRTSVRRVMQQSNGEIRPVSHDTASKNDNAPAPLTKSVENTGSVPNGISDLKTSVRSVFQQCNGGTHSISRDTTSKNDNAPAILTKSVESRDSLPNGISDLKMSVKRAVQQLKSSHLTKHTSGLRSEISRKPKMLFPYDLFVKLYYCDKLDMNPCGLINRGNSCYANAVLQCLAFTRPLTSYLLQGVHAKTCPKKDWCFACEFASLIVKAKQGQSPVSPEGILSHLNNIGSNLGHGREEDAHEFLRYAIDTMQSVCLKEARTNAAGTLAEETTLIQLTFGGYLRSKIKCTRCRGKSERRERMMDLTVEILGDIGTLEEALARFTATEILDGENKYHCSRCKSYERAKKKLTVLEAPNILTIALKRFQSGKFGKINKAVRFPEILDLAPYMSSTDDKSPVYSLYAVVVHQDIMNASFSGHYVCFVKSSEGKWYKTDDSRVKPVDIGRVLANNAYMLFYARCSPRAPTSIRTTTSHDHQNPKKNKASQRRSHDCPPYRSHNNYQNPDPFNSRLPFPRNDSSSDSSSIFSYSDEGSCSTESTRDSTTSAEELSDYIFGGSGRFSRNGSWVFSSEDSDGEVLSYGERLSWEREVGESHLQFLYSEKSSNQTRKQLTEDYCRGRENEARVLQCVNQEGFCC